MNTHHPSLLTWKVIVLPVSPLKEYKLTAKQESREKCDSY